MDFKRKTRYRSIYVGIVLIAFLCSPILIYAQQSYYSTVSLSTNSKPIEDMIRLDYASLYNLFVDMEQGIQGTINDSRGKIEVLVYDYDNSKSDGKGIEIYHIEITKSTPTGIYVESHEPLKYIQFLVDGASYEDLILSAEGNNIVRRAQDAKIYSPGKCINKTWTELFQSIFVGACVGDYTYASPVQPVVVEVKITGDVTFDKSKIPGIGIVKIVNNEVVLNPPGDFFSYCKSKPSSPLCQLYNSIRKPNINVTEDVLIAAHRGWWGYDLETDVPENTKAAVQQAYIYGSKIVEMDLTISLDNELIFMHDYVMKRLTNYPGNELSFQLLWSTMSQYKTRKRNGEVSTFPLSHFFEVLKEVESKQMIMMVDIKEQQSNGKDPNCLANCDFQDLYKQKESWTKIVRQCIRQAESIKAKKNLIFKTYYPPEEVYRLIGNQMFTVLWTPIIVPNNFKNSQGQPDINLMTKFIDKWNSNEYKNTIACYETNFFSPTDVMLQSFDSKGISYTNLLHYVYAKTGKRSGVFSEEPVNPKGNVNRWGKWKIKNPSRDIRGDFYRILNIPYGNIMLITSDRIDIWKEIKQKF